MDRLTGHLQPNAYDFEGLVLTAYILCAFGFGQTVGWAGGVGRHQSVVK